MVLRNHARFAITKCDIFSVITSIKNNKKTLSLILTA